jgi:penicillin-insensitive murein DD-endopeptidase
MNELLRAVIASMSVTLFVSIAQAGGSALPQNGWSVIAAPTKGPSIAIGSTSHGCLAGGQELPADGVGYEVIRLSRHRFFGHADLVGFVRNLGWRAHSTGLPIFYVGDMAQPRGGPLPFGHASHQTGLDVDIWFTADTHPDLTTEQREVLALPSMVLPRGQVDTTRFGSKQVALLKMAVADPAVDRIFVNPAIKLALCGGFGGATKDGRGWLHRLSPWWGHDDHFHVRLHCPDGSPDCEPQTPVADGDGCNAALADWALHQAPPKAPLGPKAPKVLPAICQSVRAE